VYTHVCTVYTLPCLFPPPSCHWYQPPGRTYSALLLSDLKNKMTFLFV
jgi:hypothetical protein